MMKKDERRRWRRTGSAFAIGVFLVAAAGSGCGGDEEENQNQPDTGDGTETGTPDTPIDPDGTTDGGLGNGNVGTIKPVTSGSTVTSPFDATPDPAGTTIYFTAIGAKGPGVFKVAATGGAITEVAAGDPFVAPFGITTNNEGTQVYVADPAAGVGTDRGGIYALPTAGGAPALLSGTEGYVPRGVEVVGDKLWFTGSDKADGASGLFNVPLTGGAVTVVAKGAPFVDPSGLAITRSGTAYVLDTIASASRRARVIQVTGGAATTFVDNLTVGYPGGIALAQDESAVIVSGLDPTKGTDVVYRIPTATKELQVFTKDIDTFTESAGLHRARNADVYAWADSTANGTGIVFVLSK